MFCIFGCNTIHLICQVKIISFIFISFSAQYVLSVPEWYSLFWHPVHVRCIRLMCGFYKKKITLFISYIRPLLREYIYIFVFLHYWNIYLWKLYHYIYILIIYKLYIYIIIGIIIINCFPIQTIVNPEIFWKYLEEFWFLKDKDISDIAFPTLKSNRIFVQILWNFEFPVGVILLYISQ